MQMRHLALLSLWACSRHRDAATLSDEEWEHVKHCDFCVTRWLACNATQSIEEVRQRLAQINLKDSEEGLGGR